MKSIKLIVENFNLKLISAVILTAVFSFSLLLVVAFNITNDTHPANSELAYIENSRDETVVGSMVPASCESNPPIVNHFAGDCQCSVTASACTSYSSGSCTKNINFNTNFDVATWGALRVRGQYVAGQSGTLWTQAILTAGEVISVVRPDNQVICSAFIPGPPPIPPPPSSITATCPATNGAVTNFNWPASSGATSYNFKVDYAVGGAPPHIAKANGIGNTYSVTLPPGVAYSAWVHACNEAGCSVQRTNNFTCPPTLSLTSAVPIVDAGLPVRLDWTVQGATPSPDSCTPTGAWSTTGAKASSNGPHSHNVTQLLSSIYSLTCSGPGGNSETKSVTIYSPSGRINAPGCTILPGGSSCKTRVYWNTSYLLGSVGNTPTVQLGLAAPFSTGVGNLAPPGQLVDVTPVNNILTLMDTGGNFSTSVSAPVLCTETGPTKEVWSPNLDRCAPLPKIDISADATIIRSGGDTDVHVDVQSEFDLSCTLLGGISRAFSHFASVNTVSHSVSPNPPFTTNKLTSANVITVICTANIDSVITDSDEVRVNVIPVLQEI